MGYFALSLNDNPLEIINTVKTNLKLFIDGNTNELDYKYLLDFMKDDLIKLESILVQEILEESQEDKFFIKNKTEDIKLWYTLSELSTEEGLQQSLDTLNDIESINLMNGKITWKSQKEELTEWADRQKFIR